MSIQQLASSFIRTIFLATSIFVSSISIGQEMQEAMAIDSQLEISSCLMKAAKQTVNIEKEPEPFVLQTSLDDFYVNYQINAYTKTPEKSAKIYSELHANILDVFHENSIEIMSPHYRAEREGSEIAIPKNNDV